MLSIIEKNRASFGTWGSIGFLTLSQEWEVVGACCFVAWGQRRQGSEESGKSGRGRNMPGIFFKIANGKVVYVPQELESKRTVW